MPADDQNAVIESVASATAAYSWTQTATNHVFTNFIKDILLQRGSSKVWIAV